MTADRPRLTTAAVPRGWRSLLTGRWHRSSWVVAALVLLFIVFCNVPGQVSEFELGRNIYDFDGLGLVPIPGYVQEHGWPLAWARRDSALSPLSSSLPTDMNCWKPWENQPKFAFHVLPLNGLIAIAIALAAAMVFEIWRRGRSKWYQLHLRDALAVTFVVALPAAWYADQQRRHALEESVLRQHYTEPNDYGEIAKPGGITRVDRKVGGITWLRKLIGHQHFESLDRIVSARADGAGLQWAAELPDVRLVTISGQVASSDLRHLERMRRLEALEINPEMFVRPHPPAGTLTMPRLLRLRWLKATNVHCLGLANMPTLERLELSKTLLNEATFGEIASLRKLRELSLINCEIPWDALAGLASLKRLETLSLCDTRFHDDEVPHLAHMTALRELDLSRTGVTGKAMPHLARLTQLRELRLSASSFSDEEQKILKSKLPACQVTFDIYIEVP